MVTQAYAPFSQLQTLEKLNLGPSQPSLAWFGLAWAELSNSGFADMTTEQKSKLSGLMKPFENDFRFLADKGNSLKN